MDVHPPFGKLMIAFAGILGGYDGNFDFKGIGTSYVGQPVPYVTMRLVVALHGVLMVPMAYATMKNFKMTEATAVLTALFVLFENSLVTQSRYIFLDAILIFFTGVAAWGWSGVTASKEFSVKWWIYLFLTGKS